MMIKSISVVIVEYGLVVRVHTNLSEDFKQAEKKFRAECRSVNPTISRKELNTAVQAGYYMCEAGQSSVNLVESTE